MSCTLLLPIAVPFKPVFLSLSRKSFQEWYHTFQEVVKMKVHSCPLRHKSCSERDVLKFSHHEVPDSDTNSVLRALYLQGLLRLVERSRRPTYHPFRVSRDYRLGTLPKRLFSIVFTLILQIPPACIPLT